MDARALFVLISFFMIMGAWYGYQSTLEPTPHVIDTPSHAKIPSQNGTVIFTNDRADEGDNPFILSIKLIEETPSKLVFEIEYFLSDTIDGRYNISIHPNMGDWSYSANTMRTGINKDIIAVSFRGTESATATSDLMHVYINHYDDKQNKWVGKVFDREIEFTKNWKK